MKHLSSYSFPLFLLFSMLLTASCRSSKKLSDTAGTEVSTGMQITSQDAMKRLNANRIGINGMNARMKVNVEAGANHISVGGNLKMRRDRIIQLSLMAFGLVEAGRLEMTPDYFMVQDRVGHQYVQESWSRIKALKDAGIDFYTFQSLFWEELFIPGRKSKLMYYDFDFKEQPVDGTWTLQPTEEALQAKTVAVRFLVNATNGLIRQTTLSDATHSGLQVDWQYLKWTSLVGKDFPQQFGFSIKTSKKEYHATLSLSSLSEETATKDISTKIDTKRYRKVTLESVLGRLMSM